ncbi:MAG: hypothetical protein WDN30_13880 [Pararobbsia sp.]
MSTPADTRSPLPTGTLPHDATPAPVALRVTAAPRAAYPQGAAHTDAQDVAQDTAHTAAEAARAERAAPARPTRPTQDARPAQDAHPHAEAGTPRAAWARSPERSTLWAARAMARLSLAVGRPVSRLALYPITAYFMIFAPAARRASLDYLRRVLGRAATPLDGFRQVCAFAATVHDRIFLINDRFHLFDIRIHGTEVMEAQLAKRRGAFLIGAHLGSFEVLSAVGRQMVGMRASMLMYEENARKINATIAAINPKALLDIIPMGRVDSMLKVRQRLDDGEMVGLLADRTPADETTVELPFLGAPAPFPVGPFRLAALMRRPVIFMTGLYSGGNRYDVHFEMLADFSATPRSERDAAIDAAMKRYVELLEKHCRAAPYVGAIRLGYRVDTPSELRVGDRQRRHAHHARLRRAIVGDERAVRLRSFEAFQRTVHPDRRMLPTLDDAVLARLQQREPLHLQPDRLRRRDFGGLPLHELAHDLPAVAHEREYRTRRREAVAQIAEGRADVPARLYAQ